MSKNTETELNKFFLTVANYSFPENIDHYITSLKSIPSWSSHSGFASHICAAIESYQPGKAKLAADMKYFSEHKSKLIDAVGGITSGKKLAEIDPQATIMTTANRLQPQTSFVLVNDAPQKWQIFQGSFGLGLRPLTRRKHGGKIIAANDKDDFFPELIALACYSLVSFLCDGTNTARLGRCLECGAFYITKRVREDSRFCSTKHRLDYHNRKSIQTGRAADYKRRRRQEGKYQ